MLNVKIIVALLFLMINNANCQDKINRDKVDVYESVIKALEKESKGINLSSQTKKSLFASFDFSGGGRGLDTLSNRIWNKKQWIDFIKSIDTSSVADYSIAVPSSFKKRARKQLVFAPILFSKGNDKALSITKLYATSNSSGSMIAWYFEKKSNKWILMDSQTFSLLD